MMFTPAKGKVFNLVNIVMMVLVLVGVGAIVARFAMGLGASTNLSDTWPWGLWIAFDLMWIALAAGAFVMAGVIYVLGRDKYYEIGRSAVLMGLLSYSFVMVTLVADLGLPWHAWQFLIQRPEHSAMFEVSWCVGLYVTILALEFAPVVFERLNMKSLARYWKIYAPIYVVMAVSFFVYLMSHSVIWATAAMVVYSILAYLFRPQRGMKQGPIMLAIAAFTLSTMHQSSLGTLFLLMPDKLSHVWWSPILPLIFFLSAIPAGVALVIVMKMVVGSSFRRPVEQGLLAGLGRYVGAALTLYLVVRVGDLVMRGQMDAALANPLFLAEVGLGGFLPLVLLAVKPLRTNPMLLALACVLTFGGVMLNRLSVVLFGMTLTGPMPGTQPMTYTPTPIEIAVTVGLIAATILLYNIGAHTLPVLKARTRTTADEAQ
jgi:formate dehydrogenase iron-sulfur subunit